MVRKRKPPCFGHYSNLWRGCWICPYREECAVDMVDRVFES